MIESVTGWGKEDLRYIIIPCTLLCSFTSIIVWFLVGFCIVCLFVFSALLHGRKSLSNSYSLQFFTHLNNVRCQDSLHMSSNFSIKLQFAHSFVVEIPFIFMWARANQSLVGWPTLLWAFQL